MSTFNANISPSELRIAPAVEFTQINLQCVGTTSEVHHQIDSNHLVQACFNRDLKRTSALLNAGINPNRAGELTTEGGINHLTLLPIMACVTMPESEDVMPKMLRKQSARIIKVLLTHGALTQEVERDLLLHCVNHNLDDVIDALGEHNVRIRRYAYDLVKICLRLGHIDALHALSRQGCHINMQNDRGNRPFLDYCSSAPSLIKRSINNSSVEFITHQIHAFLEAGLDLEATDKIGATALMRAVTTGNESAAWALLACGANPWAALRNGVSITHLSAICMGATFLRRFIALAGTNSDLLRLNAKHLQPDVRSIISTAKAQAFAV